MSDTIPDFLRPDFRPRLRSDLTFRDIGQEAIAWSPAATRPVYLDPVAKLLAGVFDGEATSAELVDDVVAALDVNIGIADEQVRRVIMHLLSSAALDLGEDAESEWTFTRNHLPEPDW